MNMLKYKSYIAKGTMGIVLCTLFVACSGDDLGQYAQRADNANEIVFLPKTENVTRATYGLDNPHPATMGVFGFFDLDANHVTKPDFTIFKNKQVNYSKDQDGTSYWTYSPVRYWPEYSSANDFDFFGYMPYVQGTTAATLTYYDKGYTLSFDATLSVTNIKEGTDLPLICNQPHHKDAPGEIVNFDMDQTTTGFQLKFKLGTKMSNVRDFEITKVQVTGQIPYKGRVSRTYICDDDGNWVLDPQLLGKKHDIKWSNVEATAMALNITNEGGNLTLSDDEFHEWGKPFFAIPVESFAPAITVTYNVRVADSEKKTITREGVTKSIVFNENNFANLKKTGGLKPGKLNSLEIAIVPDHLYILADDDQYIGYLEIE